MLLPNLLDDGLANRAIAQRSASAGGWCTTGSRPRLPAYRAKTKGKLERPIRYVRSNFFYGRELIGDADQDDHRQRCLGRVANARTHRTTDALPRVRFETGNGCTTSTGDARLSPAGGGRRPDNASDHAASPRTDNCQVSSLSSLGSPPIRSSSRRWPDERAPLAPGSATRAAR